MLAKFSLSEISTCPANDVDKDETRSHTEKLVARIGELQCALFAEKKQALLIVLQGMDGSGKDSTVKNVFSSCSHVGVRVQEFKRPTEEDSAHDFLWRAHKIALRKGMIQKRILLQLGKQAEITPSSKTQQQKEEKGRPQKHMPLANEGQIHTW
jgi:hypothetical protein